VRVVGCFESVYVSMSVWEFECVEIDFFRS